jgi:hypothetical protein
MRTENLFHVMLFGPKHLELLKRKESTHTQIFALRAAARKAKIVPETNNLALNRGTI